MDNILEYLIPLILAGVYFFGNMMSGKSKDSEDAPPGRNLDGDDADTAERQRRIQEEIRRKIMERRQASESSQPQSAPTRGELHERRQEVEAQRGVRHAQKETREVVHKSREAPPPFKESNRRGEDREAVPPPFSWDESDNTYVEGSMQAQLKQIEETKRRAEKLKKQAAEKRKIFEEPTTKKRRSGGYFTGTVRESLKDPRAARVAFIYGEVLGQPISLRKGSSTVPGLN